MANKQLTQVYFQMMDKVIIHVRCCKINNNFTEAYTALGDGTNQQR